MEYSINIQRQLREHRPEADYRAKLFTFIVFACFMMFRFRYYTAHSRDIISDMPFF